MAMAAAKMEIYYMYNTVENYRQLAEVPAERLYFWLYTDALVLSRFSVPWFFFPVLTLAPFLRFLSPKVS